MKEFILKKHTEDTREADVIMKKLSLILGICTLLICSTFTFTVAASGPTPIVRLPTQYVTVNAVNGSTSWFKMTLTDVPSGYDVVNKTYLGWCVQLNTEMSRGVDHAARLYSSLDPNMPETYKNKNNNWSKINYLINHNQSADKSTLQEVIWYYICNDPVPINNTMAHSIISDTDLNGGNFIPSPGQKIAVLNDMINETLFPIQRTFFEFTLPNIVPIGGLVWKDNNPNGIQDIGEPGFPGVTVGLYTPNGTEVDTWITDIHGYYSLIGPSGSYYIKFNLPSGYQFSPANQGSDDTKNSDANPATGKTIIFTFNLNESNFSWDAGMYPTSPSPPGPGPNHPPTADGSAGEPYIAQIGQSLRFNGSHSYDRDGSIVSWLWSFGDGTTANGSIVTHNYTAAGTYQVYLTVTDNDGATDIFQTVALIKGPNQPPLKPTLTGPIEGRRGISYTYNVQTTDPDGDDVQYVIQWGDNSQDTSELSRSGQNVPLNHQWAAWGFYSIRVYAKDPGNLTSEMNEKVMAIDVRYVGNLGYLISTGSTDQYDAFYSNSTGKQTSTQRQQNGVYLIDTKGNGNFDYQYDPSLNEIKAYSALGLEYMMLIAGVIVVILLLLLIWFFMRRRKNKT